MRRSVERAGFIAALVVTGCGKGGSPEAVEAKANPTYFEDIAPILQARCVGCHSEGNIAPFSIETYEQAKDAAPAMKAATASRSMPPWGLNSSGQCNTWRDDLSLTDVEIALIANWADTGAPLGDPAKAAPPPPEPQDELDEVSLTIGLAVDYEPSDAQPDDYRCFVIDPKLATDRFLTAYAVRPGEPSEVHHVVVWALDSASDEATAEKLDTDDAGLGYTCFGGPGTVTARTLVGWAPGAGVTRYPAGSGLRMLAGRKVVMQVHYNLGALPRPDRTEVDVTLADAVEKEGLITGVGDFDLNLPPGQSEVMELADTPFPPPLAPVQVHGVFPHMHKYGRTMRVDLFQGLSSECLVDVPRYSFEWQRFYFYAEPKTLPMLPGMFRIKCTYDTAGAMSTVHYGEGTGDEMCLSGFYVTY